MCQIPSQSCCNSPHSQQHVRGPLNPHTSASTWHPPASWIFWRSILASVISTLAEIMFCHCSPCPVLLWLPSAFIFTSPTFHFLLTMSTSCLPCRAVCFSHLKAHAIWTSYPEVRNPTSYLARWEPKDYPPLTWFHGFTSILFSGCLTLFRASSGLLCPASSNLNSPIAFKTFHRLHLLFHPTWIFAHLPPSARTSLSPTLLILLWLMLRSQLRLLPPSPRSQGGVPHTCP